MGLFDGKTVIVTGGGKATLKDGSAGPSAMASISRSPKRARTSLSPGAMSRSSRLQGEP